MALLIIFAVLLIKVTPVAKKPKNAHLWEPSKKNLVPFPELFLWLCVCVCVLTVPHLFCCFYSHLEQLRINLISLCIVSPLYQQKIWDGPVSQLYQNIMKLWDMTRTICFLPATSNHWNFLRAKKASVRIHNEAAGKRRETVNEDVSPALEGSEEILPYSSLEFHPKECSAWTALQDTWTSSK